MFIGRREQSTLTSSNLEAIRVQSRSAMVGTRRAPAARLAAAGSTCSPVRAAGVQAAGASSSDESSQSESLLLEALIGCTKKSDGCWEERREARQILRTRTDVALLPDRSPSNTSLDLKTQDKRQSRKKRVMLRDCIALQRVRETMLCQGSVDRGGKAGASLLEAIPTRPAFLGSQDDDDELFTR